MGVTFHSSGQIPAALLVCDRWPRRLFRHGVVRNCRRSGWPRPKPSGGGLRTAVALVFLRRDCPVWSRYAPIIQKLSQQYAKSPTFWLVYPDKTDTPQAMRQYLADYGYRLPALRDPEHSLVERSIWLDATSTGRYIPAGKGAGEKGRIGSRGARPATRCSPGSQIIPPPTPCWDRLTATWAGKKKRRANSN